MSYSIRRPTYRRSAGVHRTLLRTTPAFAVFASLLCGCAHNHAINPSFPLTVDDAIKALNAMEKHPRPLVRPLVILGGWSDPGVSVSHLKREISRIVDDDRIVGVSFAFCRSFDECRREVIDAVDEAFAHDGEQWTQEVDVIAVSMGGLVARYAAASCSAGRSLRIARLFTISTPHRGAGLAHLPTLNRLQIDMRPASKFLKLIDKENASFQLFPYVRLGDTIVGAINAAPPEQHPWWVPPAALQPSHLFGFRDARILADIARRLRAETPFAREPRSPILQK